MSPQSSYLTQFICLPRNHFIETRVSTLDTIMIVTEATSKNNSVVAINSPTNCPGYCDQWLNIVLLLAEPADKYFFFTDSGNDYYASR